MIKAITSIWMQFLEDQ